MANTIHSRKNSPKREGRDGGRTHSAGELCGHGRLWPGGFVGVFLAGYVPGPAAEFGSGSISSEKMRIFLTAIPTGTAAALGGVV